MPTKWISGDFSLAAAAIGGSGSFLLCLSIFNGYPLLFYALVLLGIATVIVRRSADTPHG